jgi:mycothiol synthase
MRRDLRGELPPVVAPAGYSLRTYEGPADDEAWVRIMNNSLNPNHTVEKFRQGIVTCPQFRPEILYFVMCNGTPVGSTCAWRRDIAEHRVGYVHMVGVVAEHRGKGLGRLLVLRGLHYFKEHDFDIAILNTDDFRLPAIKTYLRLGFQPVIADASHPERWLEVFKKIEDEERPGSDSRRVKMPGR